MVESTYPTNAEAWKQLLDASPQLSARERQAMTIHFVQWPEGATNLSYLTQREMAARIGVSVHTFLTYLRNAEYKLGFRTQPPRTDRIPPAVRRALLEAVGDSATCDLCQRAITRLPLAVHEGGFVAYADIVAGPRFTELVSIDHIMPVSLGGTDDAANLRVVHAICNMRDGARRPLEEYAAPPFGYVRRRDMLPNGRGPRTWIEVEPAKAAVVRFIFAEYATAKHSIRSLARALEAAADEFDARAIESFIRGDIGSRSDRVLEILHEPCYGGHPGERLFHDRPLRSSPYPPLVDEHVAAACGRQLGIRSARIQRALDTRARRHEERTHLAEAHARRRPGGSKRPQ